MISGALTGVSLDEVRLHNDDGMVKKTRKRLGTGQVKTLAEGLPADAFLQVPEDRHRKGLRKHYTRTRLPQVSGQGGTSHTGAQARRNAITAYDGAPVKGAYAGANPKKRKGQRTKTNKRAVRKRQNM
jgi:hypothetical protein